MKRQRQLWREWLLNPAAMLSAITMALLIFSWRGSREKFYSDLADAIRDKEKISVFLSIRRTRALEQRDSYAPIYSRMLERYGDRGLAYMLNGIVPDSDNMVISAIEDHGKLDDGLRFLATTVKGEREMKEALMGSLFMPTVVFIVSVVYIAVMGLWVIPVFTSIAPHEEWGRYGQVLWDLSWTLQTYGIPIGIALGSAIVIFFRSLNRWSGSLRAKVDDHLPYRILRDYNGAKFLVSLATLLSAGDTLVLALEKLKLSASPWMRWHIARIIVSLIHANVNYGAAFSTGVFSRELSNRLIDFSRRSSDFQGVIRTLGIEGVGEAKTAVIKSAKKLGIISAVVGGGIITFLIIASIVTSQDLSTSIRHQISKPYTQIQRSTTVK